MREFDYVFDVGLRKGLRADRRLRLQEQTLTEAYDVRAIAGGLVGYASPEADEEFSLVTTYGPWYWAVDGGYVYITGGPTAQTPVPLSTTYSLRFTDGITDTLLISSMSVATNFYPNFTLADFGRYLILAASVEPILTAVIDLDALTGTAIVHDHPILAPTSDIHIPGLSSVCNFRGQIVGISQDSYYGGTRSDLVLGSDKHVIYSDIGSATMRNSSRHGAGSNYIPTSASCLAVVSIEAAVIVFAEDGVWALIPVTEPKPTFRLKKLNKHSAQGVLIGAACASNETAALAVSKTGKLLMIDQELNLTELGFEEYFASYADSCAVKSDADTGDWIIKTINADRTYELFRLSSYGLTKTRNYTALKSPALDYVIAAGVFSATVAATPYIVTDITDLGAPGIKTIHTIDVMAHVAGTLSVGVYYRYSTKDSFSYVEMPVNDRGEASGPISGIEFKFKVMDTITDRDEAENSWFDNIIVRWKMSDMRSIRGVHSPGIRGQYS